VKIGLISSSVPLVNGGYRFIVDWLFDELMARGNLVEKIYLPFVEDPNEILAQMTTFRMIELESHFERVITFRPPAHIVSHSRKVVWFIHHIRGFYDLWETQYCGIPNNAVNRGLRAAIMQADGNALAEAYRLFTNSRVVAERIRTFNRLESNVLYPPIRQPERFRSGEYGEEIVSICRFEHHKRQHLLVEAMALTKTPVRLRLCGRTSNPGYIDELRHLAQRTGCSDKVIIDARWISEEEKVEHLETALASAYAPFDEDSYGYPTIEAAHARRCTVTTSDSGGVTEFVLEDETGLVVEPNPKAMADAFDRLWSDRAFARRLGDGALGQIPRLGISWDEVIERLLS
jgi:glycosyltransferase involved in cell wall biosynthesis